MVLLHVAILTLLHPQHVTVNGVPVARAGARVEAAGRVQDHFAARGDLEVQFPPAFRRKYRGDLEISSRNGELRLILSTTEDDLVAAIVSAESPPGAFPAALAAQAILARSWTRSAKGRHGDFDFCDTTHCQHFKHAEPRGILAAISTRGLVLAWQDKVFAPAYSASCGGRTQTAEAIGWEGGGSYPYFAVQCPACRRQEREWTRRFDGADAALLRAHPHAEAARLAICRRSGWDALPGNDYELRDSPAGLALKGRGRGHGLGYCQNGGAGMAKQGSSPAEILRHYFPGTAIISSR